MKAKNDIRTEIWAACYRDPVLFAFTFLKKWYPVEHPEEISWFQRAMLALLTRRANFLLDYPDQEKVATNFFYKDAAGEEQPVFTFHEDHVEMVVSRYDCVMIPRGFSKTTLTNTSICHDIAYATRNFITLVSAAQKHAESQLDAITWQFEFNPLMIETFGALVPPVKHPYPNTKEHVRFLNGVELKARGRGGQIRGLLEQSQRPDKIVLDDVEDKESVNTDDQRAKTRSWAFSDVMYALPRNDDNATMIILGTMLHSEGLIPTAMQSREFHGIKFGAIDRQGEPLCPQFMTLKQIESSKKNAVAIGELHSWYMEIMSELRNDESAIFPARCIIIVPPEGEFVGYSLALDPAIDEKATADYCSLAALGQRNNGLIWVLDFFADKGVNPDDQIAKLFEMYRKLPRHTKVGIESIAFQRSLIHTARQWMFKEKLYFEVLPITHGKIGKVERIRGVLGPRYRSGFMRHAQRWPLLEQQLMDFPAGKDDGPDVVSMAVTLLDPYAATMAGDDVDLAKDEYEPLAVANRAP